MLILVVDIASFRHNFEVFKIFNQKITTWMTDTISGIEVDGSWILIGLNIHFSWKSHKQSKGDNSHVSKGR